MKHILAFFLLSLLAFPSFAADTKPLKVLMITGGCCHDYENQKHILAEGFSARANVEFTIVHEETEDGKKGKDIFVEGYGTQEIPLQKHSLTFYGRFGDYFALICFLWLLTFLLVRRYIGRYHV